MSLPSKGSQSLTVDIPDVRNEKSTTINQKDTVPQPPFSGSFVDAKTFTSCSSAATPTVTSGFTSTASLQSASDEDMAFETDPGVFSIPDKPSNQSETISQDGVQMSEIQNIMGQFDKDDMRVLGEDDRSPSFTVQMPFLGASVNHPPRTSSLEPLQTALDSSNSTPLSLPRSSPITDISQIPKNGIASTVSDPQSLQDHGPTRTLQSDDNDEISSPGPCSASSEAKLPSEPNSGSDLGFDFHRFLEQLRHRTADPVAKFLRSFLVEFGKKKWMAHEQGKIISDFLAFIAIKMTTCEVWRSLSDVEFDNAKEGMEKLVMNRLYSQTFSPAIPSAVPTHRTKSKQKTLDRLLERGRTGQHQEDIERDEFLGQKVRIYRWVREEHLDISPVGDGGLRFLSLAQKGTIIHLKLFSWPDMCDDRAVKD